MTALFQQFHLLLFNTPWYRLAAAEEQRYKNFTVARVILKIFQTCNFCNVSLLPREVIHLFRGKPIQIYNDTMALYTLHVFILS
jgi:hypothetical protein